MAQGLDALTREELIELLEITAKDLIALDGTWFQSLEREQGLDAAMVPVVGLYTNGPQEAKALLDDLRPKVFLPMHYRMGAVGLPAVGQVEDFLSLVENYVYYPTDTLSLDEGTKPQIAVLHCSV